MVGANQPTYWDGSSHVDGPGSVYVFRTTDGGATYGQVAKLTAADAAASDYFGRSVAIDGNTIVVGLTAMTTPAPARARLRLEDGRVGGTIFLRMRRRARAPSAAILLAAAAVLAAILASRPESEAAPHDAHARRRDYTRLITLTRTVRLRLVGVAGSPSPSAPPSLRLRLVTCRGFTRPLRSPGPTRPAGLGRRPSRGTAPPPFLGRPRQSASLASVLQPLAHRQQARSGQARVLRRPTRANAGRCATASIRQRQRNRKGSGRRQRRQGQTAPRRVDGARDR